MLSRQGWNVAYVIVAVIVTLVVAIFEHQPGQRMNGARAVGLSFLIGYFFFSRRR